MDKKANEIQKQLEVTMAFVKAADEARAEQSEREKSIRKQAKKLPRSADRGKPSVKLTKSCEEIIL